LQNVGNISFGDDVANALAGQQATVLDKYLPYVLAGAAMLLVFDLIFSNRSK
jgi:hypothetical protein